MKRMVAALSAAVLAVTGTFAASGGVVSAEPNDAYNYGEALQKSMFFYEAQQSGVLPDWNEVTWRADSMTNDYIPGGWFDAGDHLKFTLTNAYAAHMLAWGYLEYKDGVVAMGEDEEYLNNLGWALDYVAACDLGDEVVYMIGDGSFDHVWWGSAEVYMDKFYLQTGETERPYYTCNNSCIEAQMAAALAAGYLCFQDTDPDRAASYLEHATACFERADANRAIGGDDAETSYYNISTFYDDLFYAANWMYMATGEQSYLDLCESDYIPNLGTESQSTELKYTWGHCWDDLQQGGTLLYAINTGDETWKTQFRKHLEYWTTGYGGKQISYTPDGLPFLTNWGSLRHATTTAFLAYVAVDHLFADDTADAEKYTEFADSVMNYCFGDNANSFSYVVGMGDDYPHAWHHRTSSGVWDDQWTTLGTEKEHAHTLYGALVGGPQDSSGAYEDVINNYQCNEVAIDYNAGYTAALCAMVTKYGGTRDESFPQTETPKWSEFLIRASINQSAGSYTELKVYAMNHTAWPARTITNLSYRYYFDISELVDAGYSISDVSVSIGYDQHASDKGVMSISDPVQYDGNVYYVELKFADGSVVMPTGQSEHRSECQFRISIPDNIQDVWDATNDYSFQGLEQGGEDAMVETPYITMYDGDTLIWGTEPDGTSAGDVTTTEPPATTTTEAATTEPADSTTEPTDSTTEPADSTTTTTETTVSTENTTSDAGATTATTVDTTTESVGSSDDSNAAHIYGDVGLDGDVSLADAVLLEQYISQIATLGEQALQNANVNLDARIDSTDGVVLLRFLAGAVPELPYQE